MKSLRGGVAVAAVVTALSVAAHVPAAPARPMQLPSGRVQYKMNMFGSNGSQTLTWSDYGRKMRQDTKVAFVNGGQRMNINTWMISDGTYAYLNLAGIQPAGPKQVMRVKISDMGQMAGMQGMGAGGMMKPEAYGKVVGKANMLGKSCEVRQQQMPQGGTMKAWLWKGLPLKMEVTPPPNSGAPAGKVSVVATKVDEKVKPAASLFKVPAGYKIVDQPAFGGGMPRR